MSNWMNPEVVDASLRFIADRAKYMVALDRQPASFEEAWERRLAVVPMSVSDFRILDGEISGRRLEIGGKAGVLVFQEGTADHVALLGEGNRLLYVTTCPAQDVVKGGTVSIARWNIEIGAPL